ncbi:WecB/TagA/CpsF family glycosyltransferase [Candidatus Omnitrophota bacterium]
MMCKAMDFLGIKVASVTKREMVENILEYALVGRRKMITYLNAHCVNLSFSDPEYRAILKAADLVYAGGKGVSWTSKLFSESLPERVNILDFLDMLIRQLVDKQVTVYLLGSRQEIAEDAARVLQKKGIKVVGKRNGFFDKKEECTVVKEINTLRPDILMVGMGVPQQEKWIFSHLEKLDVKLCWGVGAAFEWISGHRKRAPKWMIRCGLEWVHRLYQEPRRLWKRYLLGNPIFLYRVLKEKFRKGGKND